MLIDDDLFRHVQIGIILAVPAVLLLWAFWKRRFKLGIGAAVAAFLVLTALGAIITGSQATPVLRAASGNQFARADLIGSTRYHFANGTEATVVAAGRQLTVVINNTDKPLAIMPVTYAYGGFGPRDDKPDLTIPPFSAATTAHDIAYYGQGDHTPPRTIQAGAPQVTRYWLTEAPN